MTETLERETITEALTIIDESLAKIVAALRARGLVTAPHAPAAAAGNGSRAQVHAAKEP